MKKLLICPWFGPLPEWMPLWENNIARLEQFGFEVLRDHNLSWFKDRVDAVLGIDCPIVEGGSKIHDYRCTFGQLYADELRTYDFWGHTDFDMVYGRVEHWVTDEFLDGLDLHSNHPTYVSGPWSLYRNAEEVNGLFTTQPDWQDILQDPRTTGWVETGYSERVVESPIRHVFTDWQAHHYDTFHDLHWQGEKLMEGRQEVMMAHFRRTKVYPERCR